MNRMNNEYILKSKKIMTLDDAKPRADWVAVKAGKITRVGGPGEALPQDREVLDLGEATVVPGLMDSHVHGGTTAVMLSGVNLTEVSGIQEILDLIDERCRTTDSNFVVAPFFIQPQIKEGRYPTRKELDTVSHGKKVMVISVTLHGSSINTAAWKFIGFPEDIEGLVMENGEFTGEIASDDAQFMALGNLLAGLGEGEYEAYIDDFGRLCMEQGLTTVHCLEGQFVKDDADIDLWLSRIEKGTLPFHCVLYPQLWDYERAAVWNLPRHGGCLTLDGADMDYTMALDEPYAGRPEIRGNLYHLDHEVYTIASKAHRDGKQIAFHAMGDRAIDQILYVYRRIIMEQGDKGLRHRIEHFTMPTFEHVRMAKELGLVISQQPEYTYLFDTPDGPVEEWFGPERAWRMEQYRYLHDTGIVVAGGSDAPVNSLNPLTGIHSLVNNRRKERRFDVTGAFKVYTQNVAYAAFEENERGTIKEGFYADFTALIQDPWELVGQINQIEVAATISEGRVVYRKK